MIKIKGIYNGKNIELLEPIDLSPNTPVDILIPEEEMLYWQQLSEMGLIKRVQHQSTYKSSFSPIKLTGEPLSQSIIEDRR